MRAFTDVITTKAQLRDAIGFPAARVQRKIISALDTHCRTFIARSPYLLVASTDEKGHMDVSPKGDPPGFVQVLDDTTLAIPDRPGNKRADGLLNIIENPRVGLLFLVPGYRETLRVSGSARIVRDRAVLDTMVIRGQVPTLALVVDGIVRAVHRDRRASRRGQGGWAGEAERRGREVSCVCLGAFMC